MKKLIIICLLLTTVFVIKAQNKITGTKNDFPQGVPYFDKVNFEITYQVVEDRGTIRVNLSNPKIFVHPDARYNYQGTFYSKQDLGLANWPQTQKPVNFGVYLSVRYPGGTVNHMFSCTESGTCKDNNDYILASTANKNNYKPADFRVSYNGTMTYDGQGNDQVERLIVAKTGNANATANTSTQNPTSVPSPISNINSVATRQSEPSGGQTKAQNSTTNKPWTSTQVNDYLERDAASRAAKETAMQERTAAVTNVINTIGNYFIEQAENKRQAKQRELETELAAEEEKIKREAAAVQRKLELEAKIASRKSIIAAYRPKDLPLASQEKASKIYYFIYAYDIGSFGRDENTTIYVSNVFEIAKYDDGTFPYKSNIEDDIAKLTPYKEVMHGYYYSHEEAEQKRNLFLNSFNESIDVVLKQFAYKGKPNNTSITNKDISKTVQESKYGKTIDPNAVTDTQNPAVEKSATPKKSEKQITKESKYGKTIEIK